MQEMTTQQMTEYMLSRPESNFVAFTHSNRRWPRADYLIRRALAIRYRVPTDRSFSHTGSVWAVNGVLTYFHQTWPRFKREEWGFRAFNVIVEVDDPAVVLHAREKCYEMNYLRRGYGIGKLLNFAFSMWIPGIGNTLTAGKVCSEAVAVSYPGIILGQGLGQHDIDPQFAHNALRNAGLKTIIVDRRNNK